MIKKILLPLDGSELGEKILPLIVDIARCYQAEVILITVGGISASQHSEDGFIFEDIKSIADQLEKTAEKNLSDLAESLERQGLKASWIYTGGNAAKEILSYAEAHRIDLIAMTTHGNGEIGWVLGSVAHKVLTHSTIPVLLLRVLTTVPVMSKEDLHKYFR